MSTVILRLILLSCTIFFLASCRAIQASRVEKAPLRMAYATRWGDFTMIIADKAGFFERYGVVVEPVYYPISYKVVVDLTAEEIDGGLMPIGDAINVANRTEIVVIAISDDGQGTSIVASPEIATLSDLKGKRIGIQLGTWHGLLVSEMLAAAGLGNSDIIYSNLNPEDVPEALGDEVDAGITWEPFTGTALAENNRIIFDAGQFTGSYPNVIAMQRSTVNEQPEEVRKFLKGWFDAVDFRKNNPDEANRMISEQLATRHEKLVTDSHIRILNKLENYSYYQGTASLSQPSLANVTKANADYLLRIGVLTTQPDLEILLDPSYLQ